VQDEVQQGAVMAEAQIQALEKACPHGKAGAYHQAAPCNIRARCKNADYVGYVKLVMKSFAQRLARVLSM